MISFDPTRHQEITLSTNASMSIPQTELGRKRTIAELESALDRTYFQFPLPHQNKVLSIWYCLTASEDAQRVMFSSLGAQMTLGRIIFYIDRYKYSMRYALDRVSRECKDNVWTEVPRRIVPKLYNTAGALMMAGVDHALASQLCAALHTETATVAKDPDAWRISIDESHHDKAYGAMELLGVAKPRTVDFAALQFHWIRDPSNVPKAVKQIAESVRVNKGANLI